VSWNGWNLASINMRSTDSSAVASRAPALPARRSVRTAAVGRVGRLALEYVRRSDRTVFGRTTCQTPWHLLPPIYLDDSGSAYTLLVNPSGGLVGGDHLSIDLSVGAKAHALISSPSANRVYRSLSQESTQDITITVGEAGILEWMPEHTIPFAGSRFRQNINVQLHPGATLLLWDAVASGRIAHGERWRFTSLHNHIHIRMPSKAFLREQYALAPGNPRRGAGLAASWDYVGSLFIVGDAVAASSWTALEGALAEILDNRHDGCMLGGVSQPSVPGLVVKLVTTSAPVMTQALMELWAAIRRILWNLPPVSLRKY
jgi:urease accessory protein